VSEIIRTPEERFDNLPGFPFKSNYVEDLPGYRGLRMHYVDQGPQKAEHVFLCLHGQPTWSYLYRKMIPVFEEAGNRVVAPDFFGFGRSDKPVEDEVFTFDFHRKALIAFVEQLDLRGITLVCQDWGGLLGLTLPMEMPDRCRRLLVMNTTLGTGDLPLTEGFLAWRDWCNKNPDMTIGRLMKRACPHLSPEELAAYDAPFPDARHKAGVRQFPILVPDSVDAPGAEVSRQARDWLRKEWSGQSFMAVGAQDPVLGTLVMAVLREDIQGCPAPFEVADAGHFVQEWGEKIAQEALGHFRSE